MVKEDLYVTVPSFFRCPISLDVMKSPVSLCTGVTYDRATIQRWLDSGNNTCPATMQVLHSKDLIPNYTLERLIKIWSDSVMTRSPDSTNSVITREKARQLSQQLIDQGDYNQIIQLNLFAKQSDDDCKFLLSIEGEQILPILITILGKNMIKNVQLAYKATQLSVMLLQHCKEHDSQQILSKLDLGHDFCSSMVSYMKQKGCSSSSMELRVEVSKLLELTVSLNLKNNFTITQSVEIYNELLRIPMAMSCSQTAMEASLSCLICISTPRRNRAMLTKIKTVEVLSTVLSGKEDLTISVTEKVLKLLEMVSSCKQGRLQISEDVNCVSAIVKKALKVSSAATEHAVMILWSLCCLFRDKNAQQSVMKCNGMAKILLLMQSNCSPSVRQMCCDLLKVFRVCNSTATNSSCISSYNSKTSHIMPF